MEVLKPVRWLVKVNRFLVREEPTYGQAHKTETDASSSSDHGFQSLLLWIQLKERK